MVKKFFSSQTQHVVSGVTGTPSYEMSNLATHLIDSGANQDIVNKIGDRKLSPSQRRQYVNHLPSKLRSAASSLATVTTRHTGRVANTRKIIGGAAALGGATIASDVYLKSLKDSDIDEVDLQSFSLKTLLPKAATAAAVGLGAIYSGASLLAHGVNASYDPTAAFKNALSKSSTPSEPINSVTSTPSHTYVNEEVSDKSCNNVTDVPRQPQSNPIAVNTINNKLQDGMSEEELFKSSVEVKSFKDRVSELNTEMDSSPMAAQILKQSSDDIDVSEYNQGRSYEGEINGQLDEYIRNLIRFRENQIDNLNADMIDFE